MHIKFIKSYTFTKQWSKKILMKYINKICSLSMKINETCLFPGLWLLFLLVDSIPNRKKYTPLCLQNFPYSIKLRIYFKRFSLLLWGGGGVGAVTNFYSKCEMYLSFRNSQRSLQSVAIIVFLWMKRPWNLEKKCGNSSIFCIPLVRLCFVLY